MFTKIKNWVKNLFHKPASVKEVEKEPDLLSGSWKLSNLIDALPDYHKVMRKMPRMVNTPLASVQKMGPTIIGDYESVLISAGTDVVRWKTLPAQFFVSWCEDTKNREKDGVQPTFFSGVKIDPPLNVERLPGQCYMFCLYYKLVKGWITGYFWVDGSTIRIARERRKVFNEIKCNGSYPKRIPSIVYKSSLVEFFETENHSVKAENMITELFRSTLNWWSERNKRWLVITKKDSHRVSFSVEEGRHLYFFRDRDKTVTTKTGKRKTIFHICSEHLRKTKKKVVTVREHCRGIRHFFWQGFECHIYSPGWHGRDFFGEFDGTAYFEGEAPDGYVDAAQVSEKMARVLEGTNVR